MDLVIFAAVVLVWSLICAAVGFLAARYHDARMEYIRSLPSMAAPATGSKR